MTFMQAVTWVLEKEGGYSDNPKDAGGETRFGISKRSYPHLNIKDLTREQAIEIYRKDFWMPLMADELPQGLRLILFDCAVLQGLGFAIQCMQKVAGVKYDGIVGVHTIDGLWKADVVQIQLEIIALRQARFRLNPEFKSFGLGWLARLDDLMKLQNITDPKTNYV